MAPHPQDHEPAHVHAFYAETELIIEFEVEGRSISIARRKDAIRPSSTNRADLRHILDVAAQNFDTLEQLWRRAHA